MLSDKGETMFPNMPIYVHAHTCTCLYMPIYGIHAHIWHSMCTFLSEDFVSFLRRATAALAPNGLIVVKENIAKDEDIFEGDDSSITR